MNSIVTPPQQPDRHFDLWTTILLFTLWPLLLILVWHGYGFDFTTVRLHLDVYVYFATALVFAKNHIAENDLNPYSKTMLLKMVKACHILIALVGVLNTALSIKISPFPNDSVAIKDIRKQLDDSTRNYKSTIDMDDIYKDCIGLGRKVKHYQEAVLTQILEDKVPQKKHEMYKLTIDSLGDDPVREYCQQANQYTQMILEMSMLIRTKNMQGIDEFFLKYNIPGEAKAIEIGSGMQMFHQGSLRNYLVDIMQELQPMYKAVKPPHYSEKGFSMEEFVFINT